MATELHRLCILLCTKHQSLFHGSKFLMRSPRIRFSTLLTTSKQEASNIQEEDFKELDLGIQKKHEQVQKKKKINVLPPRYTRMQVDQDWLSVWPAARSFNPSVVPLPVRQGYVEKGVPPGKFANPELMKIPNFLHLTPPAVKRQCEAIKKFCTPWPEGLETDEECERHFPVQVITSDYCHSSPTIRDRRARIVTLKVKLSNLELDEHAKDKFLRLVKDRYSSRTDELTLVAERCPYRRQNYDYARYLLTVLFHESWKVEPWEVEKVEADMERYIWEDCHSGKNIVTVKAQMWASSTPPENLSHLKEAPSTVEVHELPDVQQYKQAVTALHNEGEDEYTVDRYKDAVLRLLGLPQDTTAVQGM